MPSVEMLARIKELETENERLKRELNEVGNRERTYQDSLRKSFCEKKNLRNENAKLKCLCNHLMMNYALLKADLYLGCYDIPVYHKHFLDWNKIWLKSREAYRKVKKELMEEK